jgi:predicted nuclease with TOPRIM domain
MQIEAEIDQIYDEIRELVARSAEAPEVQAEVQRKRERLHALKVEEAAVLRHRAESMRRLKPAEGERLLKHAEELLSR